MLSVRPVFGKLIAYAGTSPGPAEGITYTVQAQYSDLEAPFRVDGVIPSGFRWPSTIVWTDAAATVRGIGGVPFKVHGIEIGDPGASFTLWFFGECPHVSPCPGARPAGSGMLVRDPITGQLIPIDPPPPPPGGSFSASQLPPPVAEP